MNNKEFITKLASQTGFTQEESQKMVTSVLKEIGKSFEVGDSVQITGFGTFDIKKRMERVMVNPATGLRMLVPPKLVLNFKPTSTIKTHIKKGVSE